ncbi:unnamed protein product [Lupinus luteus]|uniref:Serine aminopeptidase S33 domain-containing protein n=1 Tax=Lupinus luteus TaxID=3873 RepID=A0AAV1WTW2_LUPLU
MVSEVLILKGKDPAMMLTSGATGRISALFSLNALKSLIVFLNGVVLLILLPFRVLVSTPAKDDHEGHRKGAVVRVPATIVAWKSSSSVSSGNGASRRTIAIRRVLEEGKKDDSNNTVRDYWLFRPRTGDTIFTQSWVPANVKVSGRYNQFAKQLNANGYKVYGMDWIGHGGSDGLHGYVHSLDDAVSDMKVFLEKILTENSGLPCFCFGHSTGGAITLKALLDPKIEARISGAVLTSPAIGVEPSHPILLVLAPIASVLLPTYQCSSAYKKGLPVSRDPEALIAKYSDPLVSTGPLRVRTGYEILRITSYLQQNLTKVKVPFFVLHGTADSVTDPAASKKLYEEAASTDKTSKLYEGFSHDLLFEPERDAITQEIIQWLNSRV